MIKAECVAGAVTTVGKPRPSNAAWDIDVSGRRTGAFPGDCMDTQTSVAARLVAWLNEHPEVMGSGR